MERRTFLQLLGAGAAAAAFPASILRALAIPASGRTGTLADIEHVVFFMQENRSFDHYFGALRGVRGFGDPHPARLAGGAPVWRQPRADGYVLPFHPGAPNLGLRFLEDLPHDWTSTQQAWNRGRYDGWVAHKGATTMAHLVRADIPFHYALADAFTICDAYHGSLLGPTDPNRMYMWTGWVGNDGRGGGPVVDDAESGYAWATYPERLQAAGVSWKVYQDTGTGLSPQTHWGDEHDAYIGNYGDNTLLYFRQFQNAAPASALYQRARTGTRTQSRGNLFEEFRRDVIAGHLPQVAWIVAPEAYCEHPNWPANYGAWYTAQVLDALTAAPKVFSKSVLFLTYDENDGFFDHIVPPTPPLSSHSGHSTVSTEHEIFPGSARNPRGPYGLGVRVPMLVVSPWSKGGWVSSEVFDHTSLLRFLERRFGVHEPNITPWRRAVCGDLTSTLDFAAGSSAAAPLPPTASYAPPDRKRHPDYKPVPPARQRLPVQEPGQRPTRPVPYELHASAAVSPTTLTLTLRNSGTAAAGLQVRSPRHEPRVFTLVSGGAIEDSWYFSTAYQLELHGPNGFFRAFAGQGTAPEPQLRYDRAHNAISISYRAAAATTLSLRSCYAVVPPLTIALPSGQLWRHTWNLDVSDGWYDFDLTSSSHPRFHRRFAGHLETGRNSLSDPNFTRALDS
ncbi:MAG: phosphocholine-specific phospholipase C [Terriglobales bacterium]